MEEGAFAWNRKLKNVFTECEHEQINITLHGIQRVGSGAGGAPFSTSYVMDFKLPS